MAKIGQIALGLLLASYAFTAQAQNYPNRPVKLIVSIAAGSVADVIMRKATAELAPKVGQPFIIENRGGANGIVAAQACAKAAPDGYTLCVIYHTTMSYNPLLFDKLPYDPDRDLVPITRLFFLNVGLFVSAALPVSSVAELKKLAQDNPQGLNYATLGEGSFPDLFLRWLNNQWGTKIVGVPYKGGGPAAQALAANEVQLTQFGIGNFLGLIKSGHVKALAVSANERSSLLPEVPTLAEAGLGGYPGQGWWGLVAPKGTPPALIEQINREFVGLFSNTKFVEWLKHQAVVAAPTSPAEFAAFLKQDRKAAEELIKIANTKRAEYKPH